MQTRKENAEVKLAVRGLVDDLFKIFSCRIALGSFLSTMVNRRGESELLWLGHDLREKNLVFYH